MMAVRRIPIRVIAARFVSPAPARAFLGIVLLATGCSTVLPSGPTASDPLETSTSSLGPSRVPFPQITPFTPPMTTPGPEARCAALGAAITPDYEPPSAGAGIATGARPVSMALNVMRVEAIGNSANAWIGARDDETRLSGRVPGGRELRLRIGVTNAYLGEWPITVLAARAHLRLEGQARVRLKTRIEVPADAERGRVSMTFPNVAASGSLEVEVEWTEQCLRYAAVGRADVTIVPGEVVAACPTNLDGWNAHTSVLFDPPIDVGGSPIDMGFGTLVALWSEEAIAADIPVFYQWERDLEPVQAPPRSTVIVAEGNDDLRFTELEARFYRRRDVVDWLEAYRELDPVLRRQPQLKADGTFDLPVPSEPGRYVAVLAFYWESDCATGQSDAAVSIDIE